MIKLEALRPNTIGVTNTLEFPDVKTMRPWLVSRTNHLVENGWNASSLPLEIPFEGKLEFTHDREADLLVYRWGPLDDTLS